MPDLPTLTVSQVHFDRIVTSFPGATAAEKAAAYRRWLTNHLIAYVRETETATIDTDLNAEKIARVTALIASLPALPAGAVILGPQVGSELTTRTTKAAPNGEHP